VTQCLAHVHLGSIVPGLVVLICLCRLLCGFGSSTDLWHWGGVRDEARACV